MTLYLFGIVTGIAATLITALIIATIHALTRYSTAHNQPEHITDNDLQQLLNEGDG